LPPCCAPLSAGDAVAEILIIDDDRQMRRLLARVLKRAGYAVHEAENGRIGLEQLRRLRLALVITDIVMPHMEGIETIRAIRREAPATPILAISGGGSPIYLRAATEFGAMATLEKPFNPEDLLGIVGTLLKGAAPAD
jgi:DNA-binding response OmpR family regulator